MRSQTIDRARPMVRGTRWLWLSLALVLVFGVLALVVAPRGEADSPTSHVSEHERALHIYRAGEWRLYDYPRAAGSASLAVYLAGERATYGRAAGAPGADLASYRAGERGSLEPQPIAPPAGWADYRAGERALDPR